MFDLAIDLPRHGSRDLLRALHRQLKNGILDGRLKPGLQLPPTRVLAATLGISRNTAMAAYDQLLAEGYLIGRPGAGTFVAELLPRRPPGMTAGETDEPESRLAPRWRAPPTIASAGLPSSYDYDFRLGLPDRTQLPVEIWQRI